MSSLALAVPFFAGGTATPLPAGVLRHTYSIQCGASSGFIGWWDLNMGSVVSGATFNLPNGVEATIRQTFVDDPNHPNVNLDPFELRWLIRARGLGVGDVAQFPIRITCTDTGGDHAEFRPQTPDQIASFGQGIGRDYAMVAGGDAISTLFLQNNVITCRLYY